MQWSEFYEKYWDWSDSTRRTKISSLENVGPGSEVLEVVYEILDEKVRSQLIRKAMKLGARFTADDLFELQYQIPEELYAQLAAYAGLDKDDPHFDENHMTWSDFYDAYTEWSDEVLTRRVNLLRDFGPHDEVYEAIIDMPNDQLEGLLYRKAVLAGVRFNETELSDLGRWDEIPEEVDVLMPEEQRPQTVYQKPKMGLGFLAIAAMIVEGLSSFDKPKKSNYCDGDCANCPPHYGGRYGRWYYGHGHQSGCERGGNGGLWGKTYRD